jgi:hypothetical protein
MDKMQARTGENRCGSDRFQCDRWDCRMSKADCIKRQEQRVATIKNYWGSKTQPAFPECQVCSQGMQIRMAKMMK